MSTAGINGSQQTQHSQYVQELREAQAREQVGAGSLGTGNSVSFYQAGVQPTGTDGRVIPIAAPAGGSASFPVNMSDLEAMLQGLRAESEETVHQVNEQAALANREKSESVRESRIRELESQLDPALNEKKDTCATAKIVIGALLLPAGAVLIADGIKDKKAVKATGDAHGQIMKSHYGTHTPQLEEFNKEYVLDQALHKLTGKPVDTTRHLAQLNELKAQGAIGNDLHQDLTQLVSEGADPGAIEDRILNDAIQAYVDGSSPENEQIESLGKSIAHHKSGSDDRDAGIRSVEGDLAQAKQLQENDEDFQQFLAQLALMMEEEQKALNEVIENVQSGQTVALDGAQGKYQQQGQMTNHI
ncbi:hypothetical protein [Sansalvadorimonas verongulae]|uniref:hypothetical protein n=1 Tax=Sansalvadorimonas verongulae TaxID=2172824 RepID=UPI0012BBD107|nr:hypothetical protein [Sansalvadorimonas verongulae]MTI13646.1 hypothetical protein [Sansalvadorimonas verongulae]